MGSCKQSNQSSLDHIGVKQLMEDAEPEGLPLWTADTIKKTNPELVLLMDTLYRYVRSENYPSINISEKREWMGNYRKQLVAYYDRIHLGSDTINSFDKANTVIITADSLWAIDDDISTMGMIINGGTEYTRRQFQEFNEFERIVSMSEPQEFTNAMEEEFSAWQDLQQQLENIVFCLNNIFYYGGSIVGVKNSADYLAILNAHINLYKCDYDILTYAPTTSLTYGVIPEGGKQLLQNCVNDLINESYDCFDEYEGSDKDSLKSYYEKLVSANKNLSESLYNWIEARKKVIGFATDYQSRGMNLNTGEFLVGLASIVSSIR